MRSSAIRQNLVRIPEIYDSLSKAQKVWDQIPHAKPLSFHNVFYRNDDFFETHKEVFDLLTDIVQLGMLQRLKTKNINFKYVISSLDNSKADLVYLNKISFDEMVTSSPAAKTYSTMSLKIRLIGLAPLKTNQYRIFRRSDCGLKLLEISSNILDLVDSHLEQAEICNLSLGHSDQISPLADKPELRLKDFLQTDEQLSWINELVVQEVR